MNIQEALTQCLNQAKLDRMERTVYTYGVGLNCFKAYLSDQKIKVDDDVSVLTPEMFINFAAWMVSGDKSKQTIAVYMSAVRYFMDWLEIYGFLVIKHRDATRIKKLFENMWRSKPDSPPKAVDASDIDSMKEAVQKLEYSDKGSADVLRARNIALINFLSSTGCRNFEVRALVVSDFDMRDRSVWVTGKKTVKRKIYFDQETAESIKHYWTIRKWMGDKDPAFARHDRAVGKKHEKMTGTSIRNIIHDVLAVSDMGEGKFTPHYFRHAFARKVLRDTGNLALVQDLLGHASANSTRIYAKLDQDELRKKYREVFD